MKYVAMLALLAFLVVPLVGCKKEGPAPTKPAVKTPEGPAGAEKPAEPEKPAKPVEK